MVLPFISTAYAAADCSPSGGLIDKGVPGGFQNYNVCVTHPNLNIVIKVVLNLTQLALDLAGFIAILMLLIGGITYIISRGRPDLMEQAYNTLKYAILGLVVVILSYAFIYALDTFISAKL